MTGTKGTPERLGGSPRTNADDAFATFMDMSDREWLMCLMNSRGIGFEVEEQKGFNRALESRSKKGALG